MHIKSKHILTMLMVAGASLAALPAQAATTFTAGDLLLGFRSTSSPSSTVIVNLGNAATLYRDGASNSSVINIGAELTAAFGDWANDSGLSWGAVAVRTNSTSGSVQVISGDPKRTLYATASSTSSTPGTQGSTTWDLLGGGNVDAAANSIVGLQTMFQNYAGATTQSGKVAVIASSITNTWEDYTSVSSDFGSFPGSVEAINADGIDATTLDLYRILALTGQSGQVDGPLNSGSYEGSFTISSSGVVSFTAAAAVPEPSRAILAALGAAGLVLRRRRR